MATKQAQNRAKYRHMTATETIRNMSDAELDRNVRKGGRDAIREQAYRHSLQGRSMIHEPIIPELDEVESDTIRSKNGKVLYRRKLIRDGWDGWHYILMTDESELKRERRLNRIVAECRTPDLDIGV